jgi:hypothetical protein
MLTLRTGQKLQVILAGAVSATEAPITVEYAETGDDTERAVTKTVDSVTTGGTAVDVVSGNAEGRQIKAFTLYNADSASIVVTVRFYPVGGTTRILRKCTLLTLEGLHWDPAAGWYAVDANGNRKQNSASTDGAASSQASSLAAAIVPASVNSVSSQASSIAAAVVPASVNSVSSQASSIAATNPHTVSSVQSNLSVASLTSTTWATVSSATSRVKSSFSW